MRIRIALGTLFGAGYLPVAPGTWGSFFTLPLIYGTAFVFPVYGIFFFFLLSSAISLVSAPAVIDKYGHDPSQFVMDECAGQSIVFVFSAFTFNIFEDVLLLTAGFFLFRFFDIVKPLGIDNLQKLPAEIGILADDILAGIYAFICLEGSIYIYNTLI